MTHPSADPITEDRTFHEVSLYGSLEWAALTMGLSKDRFHRRRKDFETRGFPPPDAITKLYLKADVIAWVERRRRISNTDAICATVGTSAPQKVNTDVL